VAQDFSSSTARFGGFEVMIDRARRLEYLKAMGIDVWVSRGASDSVEMMAQENPPLAVAQPARSSDITKDIAKTGGRAAEPTSTIAAPQLESRSSSSPLTLDWSELESAVKACTLCELHRTRTQTVFGVGDRQAQWMVIGEAPGADEDAQGEPFVGRAGQLLTSMLKAIGLSREQVFIANILKCRPPQNRDPTPTEAGCCTPYLHRQIELVNPKLILCVGRIAAQNLLSTDTPIGKLRGTVHRLGAAQRPAVVTYHPAYLLRSPGEKRRAWDDLILAMKAFTQS
jgi:DNA polymerase